jgi:periplasmic divalent cation tolerance protein
MEKTTEFRIVFCTIDSFEAAQHISRILVSEKSAACCSIVPNIVSVFTWQGTVNERREYLIIIKTTFDKLEILKKRICELHSDEVPEIISVALDEGLPAYFDWIRQTLNEA